MSSGGVASEKLNMWMARQLGGITKRKNYDGKGEKCVSERRQFIHSYVCKHTYMNALTTLYKLYNTTQ